MFEKRLPVTGWLGILGRRGLPIGAWLWTGAEPFQDWSGVLSRRAVVAILIAAMAQEGELAQAPRSAALGALAWAYTGLLPAAVVALRRERRVAVGVLALRRDLGQRHLAYFTGRFLGKRPFAPRISPKKTWEGFWAAPRAASSAHSP